MGLLSKKFGVIEIAPGVTATLENKTLDWMDPYFCGNPKAGEIKPGDEDLVCTSRETTQAILAPIIQDGLILTHEAGPFSYVLSEVAGGDHYLDASEITLKNLDDGMITIGGLYPDDKEMMTKEHLFAVTKGEKTPHLFSKKPSTEDAVNHHLKVTKEILEFFLKVLEEEKARLYEESLSFTHFISAENLFGLSAYLTYDGTPFSHNELDGVRRAIRMIRDIVEGLEVFKKQFEKGTIDENHPAVKKFLESPAAEHAHLGFHLGFGRQIGNSEEENNQRLATFISKMSGLVAEANATRTAEILAESYRQDEGLKDLITIDSPYGNTIFRWLDGQVTDFANTFVSLDSLALAATGTLAGKALLSTAKGAQYGLRIFKALGKARPLLPGGLGFSTSSAKWGMKLGAAAGNVVWELAKMNAYQVVAFKIGDREGMEVVGRVYMFAGGFLSAVEQGLLAKIADDVLADRAGPVVDDILMQADDEVARTAYAAAPFAGQRSLRWPKGVDPEILWRRMQQGKAVLSAGGRELMAQIDAVMERLKALVAASGGVLKARLVQTAARLLAGPDKASALRQIEKMLEDAQKKLEAAAERARQAEKSGPAGPRKMPTPVRGVPRLTAALLSETAKGRASLSGGVLEKINAFVKGDAKRHEALLAAIRKISAGNLSQFRTTQTAQGTFLSIRERSFQILFKQVEGGLFEIVEFIQR